MLLDVKGSATCRFSVSPCCYIAGPLRNKLQPKPLHVPVAIPQEETTYRNACRACASCCGAFRNWRYPSLYRSQSPSSRSNGQVGARRTHFGWGLCTIIISKWGPGSSMAKEHTL